MTKKGKKKNKTIYLKKRTAAAFDKSWFEFHGSYSTTPSSELRVVVAQW